MKISASVTSSSGELKTSLQTDEKSQALNLPCKSTGFGSAVNGGELLMLAIATCYCNDLYREAAKRNIVVERVHVECTSVFGKEGEAASGIVYSVNIESPASPTDIEALIRHTDTVAEIHNTIRKGTEVMLIRKG